MLSWGGSAYNQHAQKRGGRMTAPFPLQQPHTSVTPRVPCARPSPWVLGPIGGFCLSAAYAPGRARLPFRTLVLRTASRYYGSIRRQRSRLRNHKNALASDRHNQPKWFLTGARPWRFQRRRVLNAAGPSPQGTATGQRASTAVLPSFDYHRRPRARRARRPAPRIPRALPPAPGACA